MNTHAFEKKLHSLKARFGLQLFVLAAVVCTSWIVTDHANAVYILTGPEDAAALKRLGADATLVGEALMRAPDKGAMLASLRRAAE